MIGRDFWNISTILTKGYPEVNGTVRCPVCSSDKIFFKHARWFVRGKDQYRVDISIKCANCAYIMVFGVHITKDEYDELSRVGTRVGYENVGHININEVKR